MTRASMLAVLGSDFIRTAHAMGLSRLRIIVAYALRNALLPVHHHRRHRVLDHAGRQRAGREGVLLAGRRPPTRSMRCSPRTTRRCRASCC